MANRVTQVARELLQKGGNPNALVTQVAREALQQGGNPNARVTQDAREVLVRIGVGTGIQVPFVGIHTLPTHRTINFSRAVYDRIPQVSPSGTQRTGTSN